MAFSEENQGLSKRSSAGLRFGKATCQYGERIGEVKMQQCGDGYENLMVLGRKSSSRMKASRAAGSSPASAMVATFLSVTGVVASACDRPAGTSNRTNASQDLRGVSLFGVTWRLDLVAGLGVLIYRAPFPRGTVYAARTRP